MENQSGADLYELAGKEITKHMGAFFEAFLVHGQACGKQIPAIYSADEFPKGDSLPGMNVFFHDAFNSALLSSHTLANSLADSIRANTRRQDVNQQTTNSLKSAILADSLSEFVGKVQNAKASLEKIGAELASESTIKSMLVGAATGKAIHWGFGGDRSDSSSAMMGAAIGGLISSVRKAQLRRAEMESLIQGLSQLVTETEKIPALLIDQYITLVSDKVDIQARDEVARKAAQSITAMAAPARKIIESLSSAYDFLAASAEQRKRYFCDSSLWKIGFVRALLKMHIALNELIPFGPYRSYVDARSNGQRVEAQAPLRNNVAALQQALTVGA